MIELLDNLVQFLVALVCGALAGLRYVRSRRHPYFLLACFYACFSMAGLYWTLYYLLYDETPHVFYVSEAAWLSSWIFLALLQYFLADEQERAFRCRRMWLSPAIGLPLFVFYCTYGDVLMNALSMGLMMLLCWNALRGLAYRRGSSRPRAFHWVILCNMAAEYSLWTSGCFWMGDTLANPYFWFDFVLTATLVALLVAVGKAVET